MKKFTMFSQILQSVIPQEEIAPLINEIGYVDKARKFTVYDLFLFLAQASIEQWKGYRDGEARMGKSGLQIADHSTISKKAKEVPYQLFKELLHLLIRKCNRATKRKLRIPKELLAVDSTKITVGKGRLPWAPLKGERSGVKLHVALVIDQGNLHRVTESTGNSPDLVHAPEVIDPSFVIVADRAYGKHEMFDKYESAEKKQYFLIRIRDNTILHDPTPRKRKAPFKGTIERDITCQLGVKKTRTKKRFRVVTLKDPEGNPVILATNLHKPSAENIAEMYKKRWQIEVLFRWIKQHLNVPKLFGTTPNAVYGQLYTALLVYVLMKLVFEKGNASVHASAKLTFAEFDRLFELDKLPSEWLVLLTSFLKMRP
ncbi:IS4 family transposase [Paenibacillus sp. GCM10027626]|uniref:IS4 family transposase n=1 Tax=Paenibacillus sp. GCM10027626 TaxID=3273411 RepID=UPI0036396A6A